MISLFLWEPASILLAVLGLIGAWAAEDRGWLKAALFVMFTCAAVYSAAGGRAFRILPVVSAHRCNPDRSLPMVAQRTGPPRAAIVLMIVSIGLGKFCALKPMLLFARTGTPFVTPYEDAIEGAATYVREHTTPQDGVLVWGYAPQIYVLSDRFRTFRDAGLLSIAGANCSSIAAEDQGRIPRWFVSLRNIWTTHRLR